MDLEQKLKIRFPKMIPADCSINAGDGWEHIINNMFCELLPHNEHFHVEKIKEKFGSLRVEVNFTLENVFTYDDLKDRPEFHAIRDIIVKYESASEHTCYDCGARDAQVQNIGHWVVVICDECKGKREND